MVSNDVALDLGDALRGAAADGEGARDRAAGRLAPRAGRLPALTEAGLGERVRASCARFRFAAKVEIEPEEHDVDARPRRRAARRRRVPVADYGEPAWRGARRGRRRANRSTTASSSGCGSSPARRGPGREIDDRVLPAEAGLDRARGQLHEGLLSGPGAGRAAALPRPREPRPARARIEAERAPGDDAELTLEGKPVGRVTSAVRDPEGGILALAYVRREVPEDAELAVTGTVARAVQSRAS